MLEQSSFRAVQSSESQKRVLTVLIKRQIFNAKLEPAVPGELIFLDVAIQGRQQGRDLFDKRRLIPPIRILVKIVLYLDLFRYLKIPRRCRMPQHWRGTHEHKAEVHAERGDEDERILSLSLSQFLFNGRVISNSGRGSAAGFLILGRLLGQFSLDHRVGDRFRHNEF